MPVDQFFVGPGRSALKHGEILTELRLPPPPPNTGSLYIKDSPRSAMDIAAVGVASVVSLDAAGQVFKEVKIAMGAVGPTPFEAKAAAGVLVGKQVTQVIIDEAARVAVSEARPIDDIRATAAHRRAIVEQLTRRTLHYAVQMARSSDIPFEMQRDLAVEAVS